MSYTEGYLPEQQAARCLKVYTYDIFVVFYWCCQNTLKHQSKLFLKKKTQVLLHFTVCVIAAKIQTTWRNHNCSCRCIDVKGGLLWLLEHSWIGNLLSSLPHSGCWIIVIESSRRFIFADRGRLKPSPLSRRSLCEVAGVETCTAFVLRHYSPAVLCCGWVLLH